MATVSYRYFHSFRVFNDSGEDVTSITPANDTYVGVLNIIPDDLDTLVQKAVIAQAEGDLPRAAALLAPLHAGADDSSALETQVYQAILERNSAPIIPRLKEVLANPALLRLDPMFDPLRNDPRFQKLVASPAPNHAKQ